MRLGFDEGDEGDEGRAPARGAERASPAQRSAHLWLGGHMVDSTRRMEGFLPTERWLGQSTAMGRSTIGDGKRVLATIATSMGALALAGCADPKVSLAPGPREYTDSDYAQVLERWTRSRSLFALSELDTLLTVTATFESWDFRWAYVVRYASDYRLTVEQRRSLLDKTLSETRDSHRFYVALYGTKVRWADLTRSNGAWIVRLIDDEGSETAPLSIEQIERPGPLERRYFPYTSVFRNVFRIKFPTTTPDGRPTIAPHSKWFGLRFAGAEGNEELHWVIEGGEARLATGPADVRVATSNPAPSRE